MRLRLRDQSGCAPVEVQKIAIGSIDSVANKAEPTCRGCECSVKRLDLSIRQPPGNRAGRSIEFCVMHSSGRFLMQQSGRIVHVMPARFAWSGRGVMHHKPPASRPLVVNIGCIAVRHFGRIGSLHGDLLN